MRKCAFSLVLFLFLSNIAVFADTTKPVASGKATLVETTSKAAVADANASESEDIPKTEMVVTSSDKEKVSEPSISWGRLILKYILDLIFAVLGIVATGFATVLLKKYKFESFTSRVNDLLEKAIGYAEQKSAQSLKLSGKPLEGQVKLDLAYEFIKTMSSEYGIYDKSKEWWVGKVEGWLGLKKIG